MQTAGHDSYWMSYQAMGQQPDTRLTACAQQALTGNHRCMVCCVSASRVMLSPHPCIPEIALQPLRRCMHQHQEACRKVHIPAADLHL